ncbi:MAG: T9SS type A sorting domain-containing protein [Candidatus Latescibacteria bacterium]|nr:T9SS type A sorting domain-containing protein [Candidatus Latescibacterota bacterium]NIM65573.1 T9SS type A sorting domain-containing protein [Candidatus Latescibacterota bacterium]NIO01953.1 T9SS type A sorting domain-containing protein [Candidatus Latescibacterota bacterium]NIO28766.1 T9SS type A sorting domain-containing protein [Candidatus Latescibacterota bacterium]NIO56391.1 T9SS type A sorting domain-containing protein [Candidatus Latescibacterota bacterium]
MHVMTNSLAKCCSAAVAAGLICLGSGAFETLGQRQGDGYEILYGTKMEPGRDARGDGREGRWFSVTGIEGSAGFDMLHNRIDITIDPATEFVAGTVDATFRVSTASLDSIFLHLKDNMTADSVWMDESPLLFSRSQGKVSIDLSGTYSQDDILTVRISYSGYPDQGLRFRDEAIYNLSEPDLARNWFPCYDEPWDKVTSEMIVTVPDTLFCASNGLLISETNNGDGTKTFHWSTLYRHPTYTISIAISNYVSFSHWYHYTPSDSMEMPYYVYPRKLAAAQASFSNAPDMMEFYSDMFGQYPFLNEVYGTALVPLLGAMENFTCTSFGSGLIWGTHDNDWVVAHEMAHSWFGNSVTMSDWREIWLNEGFATYADALWHEHIGGRAALNSRMVEFRDNYFVEDATNRFPIYDPDWMWGATVYEKGAWILHMLRYLMGDSAFFDALRSYHASYAYNNASIDDFRAACETVSGLDLTNFFLEWVYQAGYPEYEYSWNSFSDGSGYQLNLNVVQTQVAAPVFTIPIEILVTTSAGDSVFRLPVSHNVENYRMAFSEEPISLTFDPDSQILKTAVQVPAGVSSRPPSSGLSVVLYPNPTNGPARVDFFLPEPGDAVLEIFDVSGRLMWRNSKKNLPADRNSFDLDDGSMRAFLPRSGVYFYKLQSRKYSSTGKLTVVR